MTRDVVAAAMGIALAASTTAQAQAIPEAITTPRFVVGPLGVIPAVSVRDVGIDTNVFNQNHAPTRDYTGTLAGTVELGARLARARLHGRAEADYVHFAETRSERSLNGHGDLQLDIPIGRLTPFMSLRAANTRHRFGFEIDARARYRERITTAGVALRVGGKTTLGLAVHATRVSFAGVAVFRGTSLRDTLNRWSDGASLAVRYALTPLTTVKAEADARRDRFEFQPERNAESGRLVFGVEFSPHGSLRGSAVVGARRFTPLNPCVAVYDGLVTRVDLSARLGPRVGVAVEAARDVEYSYNPNRPYYVAQTGIASLILQVAPGWDVGIRGGRHILTFRPSATRLAQPAERAGRDVIDIAGASIGYLVGRTSRVGLDAHHYRRSSTSPGGSFEGVRLTTSYRHAF